MVLFERAMLVSIMTIVLSVTIQQPQFAIECCQRSNHWGHLGAKIGRKWLTAVNQFFVRKRNCVDIF